MTLIDNYHKEGCGIFIGKAANGRYVEKPCTCGLDEAIAALAEDLQEHLAEVER